MYRRRRRPERPVLFSFDSFLDVVANVIGIIIRLILVAWVGARAYKGPPPPDLPPIPEFEVPRFSPPTEDQSLARELEQHRAELERARRVALDALRDWESSRQRRADVTRQFTELTRQRELLEGQRTDLEKSLSEKRQLGAKAALTLREFQERQQKLRAELESIQKAPRVTRELAYKLPVSAPVQSEELFLECRAGRVAIVDVGAMVDEIREQMQEKGQQLKSTWSIDGVTTARGPYRLRYTLERERGLLEGSGPPNSRDSFRYGLASWVVEPVQDPRGETAEDALKPGSHLRRVTDRLDPQQTVVTLWVYPDSFPLYRQLRDHLHERDLVVAGRPLPAGTPIAMSRKGSSSRGQ